MAVDYEKMLSLGITPDDLRAKSASMGLLDNGAFKGYDKWYADKTGKKPKKKAAMEDVIAEEAAVEVADPAAALAMKQADRLVENAGSATFDPNKPTLPAPGTTRTPGSTMYPIPKGKEWSPGALERHGEEKQQTGYAGAALLKAGGPMANQRPRGGNVKGTGVYDTAENLAKRRQAEEEAAAIEIEEEAANEELTNAGMADTRTADARKAANVAQNEAIASSEREKVADELSMGERLWNKAKEFGYDQVSKAKSLTYSDEELDELSARQDERFEAMYDDETGEISKAAMEDGSYDEYIAQQENLEQARRGKKIFKDHWGDTGEMMRSIGKIGGGKRSGGARGGSASLVGRSSGGGTLGAGKSFKDFY